MGSVALWGCDEDGDTVICKPNETRICQCSTGGVGIEGCSSDGTAWSPCYCTGDGDIDTDAVDQIDTTDDVDTDPVDTNCSVSGEVRCNGQQVEVCTQDLIWTFQKDCTSLDMICQQGECISENPGECTPGEKSCKNNTEVLICGTTGQWEGLFDCGDFQQICQDGQCVATADGDEDPVDTGDCSNGAVRCIGNIVFVCQSGDWQQQEDCGDSYRVCSEGICTCTAGEKKCDADNLQTCISNSWQTTTNCAQQDETCYEGACACRNDSYRCQGTVRQYCYNHDWNYDTYDCAEDDYVCYEGDCVVCYGDMKKCDGDYVYFCEIDDYWGNNWEYEQDCSNDGKVCENGACVNAP